MGYPFASEFTILEGVTDITVVESTFIPPLEGLNFIFTGVTPSTHEMPIHVGYALSSFCAETVDILDVGDSYILGRYSRYDSYSVVAHHVIEECLWLTCCWSHNDRNGV